MKVAVRALRRKRTTRQCHRHSWASPGARQFGASEKSDEPLREGIGGGRALSAMALSRQVAGSQRSSPELSFGTRINRVPRTLYTVLSTLSRAQPERGTLMTFRPLHDRVAIRRLEGEAKSKGGILIPDTVKEKPQQGEVIAVGPGVRDKDGAV